MKPINGKFGEIWYCKKKDNMESEAGMEKSRKSGY